MTTRKRSPKPKPTTPTKRPNKAISEATWRMLLCATIQRYCPAQRAAISEDDLTLCVDHDIVGEVRSTKAGKQSVVLTLQPVKS